MWFVGFLYFLGMWLFFINFLKCKLFLIVKLDNLLRWLVCDFVILGLLLFCLFNLCCMIYLLLSILLFVCKYFFKVCFIFFLLIFCFFLFEEKIFFFFKVLVFLGVWVLLWCFWLLLLFVFEYVVSVKDNVSIKYVMIFFFIELSNFFYVFIIK